MAVLNQPRFLADETERKLQFAPSVKDLFKTPAQKKAEATAAKRKIAGIPIGRKPKAKPRGVAGAGRVVRPKLSGAARKQKLPLALQGTLG